MKKLEYIFSGIAVLALTGAYFFFRPNTTSAPQKIEPSIASPSPQTSVTKQDLKLPAGEVVELIRAKNWIGLSAQFSKSKQRPDDLESKLSQIIYSLDSQLVAENEHEKIMNAILLLIDTPDDLQPRTLILISKSIGKLKLSNPYKKTVEAKYTRNKWTTMQHWIDASIEWEPLPASTLKKLNALVVKNRSDLMSDYFYYLNKINNKKILKQQINTTKSKLKLFLPQQQAYIRTQLEQLERKL